MMDKNNNQEVFHKTNINWYPGHMKKAMNQIEQDVKLVDIIIEILDARIPISSQNPEVQKIIKNARIGRSVSLTSVDLPEPLTPVMQMNLPSGNSAVTFLRLLPRAPRITIRSPVPLRSVSGIPIRRRPVR